jgi:hypothetical protein
VTLLETVFVPSECLLLNAKTLVEIVDLELGFNIGENCSLEIRTNTMAQFHQPYDANSSALFSFSNKNTPNFTSMHG